VDFPLTALQRLSFTHVTEIPEHLLKRSKAAKAKADGAEPAADAPAAASTAPATTAAAPAVAARAAAPAVPAAPVVQPDIPVVAAYKARKKVPVWAMVTLSILPVWMFMYVLALKPVIAKATGPLGDGAKAYSSNCSTCHGAAGEGVGSAYAFVNGSVMKTFPRIEDQLRWVSYGTDKYNSAGVSVYGNPSREGGVHITGASGAKMPGWRGNLVDADILAAVCHERYDLGGGDKASNEYTLWCAPDSAIYAGFKDGSVTMLNVGDKFKDKGVIAVGAVPLAGVSK
jgi:mono/diheme cytochrome c family protein